MEMQQRHKGSTSQQLLVVQRRAEAASEYVCAYLAAGGGQVDEQVRGLRYWHCSALWPSPQSKAAISGGWRASILWPVPRSKLGGGAGRAGDTHSRMLTSTILSSWVVSLWGFPAYHFLQKCAETCFYDTTVTMVGFKQHTYHKYPTFHFNLI